MYNNAAKPQNRQLRDGNDVQSGQYNSRQKLAKMPATNSLIIPAKSGLILHGKYPFHRVQKGDLREYDTENYEFSLSTVETNSWTLDSIASLAILL